jgi:hypothetical protein
MVWSLAEARAHTVWTLVHHHDSVVQVRARRGEQKTRRGVSLDLATSPGVPARFAIVALRRASLIWSASRRSETVEHPGSIARSADVVKRACETGGAPSV